MTSPEIARPDDATISRQGNYAGAASRLVAFAIDAGAIWGIGTLFLALLSFSLKQVLGVTFNRSSLPPEAGIIALAWAFFYFAYQWSLSGRTIGMAIFGLQVVRKDGAPVSLRAAAVRTLVLPLSFLCLGLGLLGILTNRQRQAWHDRAARTAVVYSWDARAARLRWLARHSEPVYGGR